MNFVEDVALVLFSFFTDNQLFSFLSQVLIVDVPNHAGSLHASGIEICLAIDAKQLIQDFGGLKLP